MDSSKEARGVNDMSPIKCQMQQGIDGAEFSVGHIFVFAGEKTPNGWPCQCGMVRYSENSLEELTQSKARVRELEELFSSICVDLSNCVVMLTNCVCPCRIQHTQCQRRL